MYKIKKTKSGFDLGKDGRRLAHIREEKRRVRVEPIDGAMAWVDEHLMEADVDLSSDSDHAPRPGEVEADIR